MNEVEYYLSTGKDPSCPQIPGRYSDYLDKKKHLSEFTSEIDKDKARENLGINEIINFLNQKIDAKVIKYGGINWDRYPTQGHCQSVLSSDALYKTLCRYIPRSEVDALMQQFWVRIKTDLNEILNPLIEKVNSYSDMVESFLQSEGNGTAVVDKFGEGTQIGINQKVLTKAISRIWEKLEDITGECMQGISMSVTPKYFIGEDGSTVHIRAEVKHPGDVFNRISFYINGDLLVEDTNVSTFEYDTEITETSEIKCIAIIDGLEYTKQQIITHYNSFWLGCGQTYEDVMNMDNLIPMTRGLRGSYDVHCEEDDHIIIILGEGLRHGFWRADMNSVEIPFNEELITVDDNNYIVLTSQNTYAAGNYNIDINQL